MNKIGVLYRGEILRMWKYGVSGASLVTALIWIAVLRFSAPGSMTALFPLLIFVDSTVMTLLLVGVTIIFENQENSFKSLMVSPISKDEYLVSKSLAVVTSSVITLALLLAYGLLVADLEINIPAIFGAVILVAFTFAQVGTIMTYYSKDFTDLLMGVFKFTIVFTLPTLLEGFKVLKGDWVKTVQYFNPTKSALVLLAAATEPVDAKDLAISLIYLLALSGGLHALSRRLLERYVAKGGA
ncbi:MAG TPA: ABC transporter permease [Firmicutes bacterium]|nr:ABC transporter permease [Candidatus Fermentithermobacillaceae bacterium]